MEDLSAVLQSLLRDPDTVQKLRGTLDALSNDTASEPSAPSDQQTPDLSALVQLLPTLQSAVSDQSDDIRLLQALRPFLHGERAKRLDRAGRMLRLRGMLPLLQQSGLFSGLLGGDE